MSTQHWNQKPDYFSSRDKIFRQLDGRLESRDCGAVVVDQAAHDGFHDGGARLAANRPAISELSLLTSDREQRVVSHGRPAR